MPSVEQLIDFRPLLAQTYPTEVKNMYAACAEGALRHADDHLLFSALPTNIADSPMQDVECQIVTAKPEPITSVVGIGEVLSPGFIKGLKDFKDRNEAVLGQVNDALDDGYNVAIAVPTHSQVHDIALPDGQIMHALWELFGRDDPANHFQMYAKALAWYEVFGKPVPEIARQMANVAFSLPHSKSGDDFDDNLQKEFNQRTLMQMGSQLKMGGQIVTLATGGATNYKKYFRGKLIAECQGAIYEGTARFLTHSQLLVLPVACYLDKSDHLTTRLGELQSLESDQDCLDIGIWAAHQYHEMSGIHTFQARTREQLERFAEDKVTLMREAVKVKRFVAWLNRKNDNQKPSELVEQEELVLPNQSDSKQTA